MMLPQKIDLHMHTTVSDGTDTPEEIVARVKEAGIDFFSITDHDATEGGRAFLKIRKSDDPAFVTGVEFSCKDEEGKYHVLGYRYDPYDEAIQKVVEAGHQLRMKKVLARLDFLKTRFMVSFPEEEIAHLLALDNPGKPHIGNLMVKYGYAETKEKAITDYINQIHFHNEYVRPEAAIQGILDSGGIPVLAHPTYGSGGQLILGEDMNRRIRRLMEFGLQGLEAYYSGFSEKIRDEILSFAKQFDLYVTAGSDYHGSNKMVMLADTGMDKGIPYPEGLQRFLLDTLENPG